MARSALFSALRRILRQAHAGDAEAAAPRGPSRRDVLAGLAAAAAIPVVPSLSGCGDDGGSSSATIAIIGGGIAGLTAAHFLHQVGADVTVYESSMRTGGRMYSQRGLPGGQLVELGGELVDTNHVVVPALCDAFGLTLDDLIEDTAGLKQDTFYFENRVLTDAELVAGFRPVAMKMQLAIAASEGTDAASVAEFERIDALSIPNYLQAECGLPQSSLIRRVLELAYLEEYGLEPQQQSAWNLIYLIDSMTPDPFRIFGDSDERFHIHEGNDALPAALAGAIGAERIAVGHKLTKVVAASGGKYELTFAADGGNVSATVDHVVYALPFTRLREVDLAGSTLSAEKLEVITELGYGTNAKLMMQFSDRHWQTAHMSGGGVITDEGQLQTIWATSRGQPGAQGILTNFVGGGRGLAMGQGTAESQAAMALPDIEAIFPGTQAKYVANSAIRQHWPSYEHAKGSYGCYTVGQWRFFGTEGLREGNQHFCGEHCSEDFQGYMEGGAETGVMAAAEIMDDLELEKPAMLVMLLDLVTAKRPRASYHRGHGKRMRPSQIRKRR